MRHESLCRLVALSNGQEEAVDGGLFLVLMLRAQPKLGTLHLSQKSHGRPFHFIQPIFLTLQPYEFIKTSAASRCVYRPREEDTLLHTFELTKPNQETIIARYAYCAGTFMYRQNQA